MQKRVTIPISIFGPVDKNNLKAGSLGLQFLDGIFRDLEKYLQDVPVSIAHKSGDSINSFFDKLGKQYLNGIKSNFIHNPPNWPKIGRVGIQMRKLLIDPSSTADYLLERLGSVDPKTKGKIKEFSSKLPQVARHPLSGPSGPALLVSGKLMESINLRVFKRQYKRKDGVTYSRQFHFRVGAPYGEPMFTGGSIEVYVAEFKTRSRQVEVLIPFQFARHFRSLDLRPIFEVSVKTKYVPVKQRDPFILKRRDLSTINKFTDEFGFRITKKAQDHILSMEGLR